MVANIIQDTTEAVEEQTLFSVIANKEQVITFTEKEHGFDLVAKFKLPTLKIKDTAEMLYSKEYNRLLQDGDHLTIKELIDVAEKRGMWSSKDSDRLVNIDSDILDKKEQFEETKGKKKRDKLEKELAALRDEKFRLALKMGGLTSTAIENIAERERMMLMLLHCVVVVDEEGEESPLYPTKQDIENETNTKRLDRILLEGKSFWTGEGLSDFLHLGD
jgi:hypothetical protein